MWTVTWRCARCGHVTERTWDDATRCAQCNAEIDPPPPSARTAPMDRCPVCRIGELYVQKDFNVRLGIAIVVLAAVLAYWTWGISLVLAVALDWVLYRIWPEVVICYYCQAHYRGLPNARSYPEFDLLKHDTYRTLRQADVAPPIVVQNGATSLHPQKHSGPHAET